MSKTSLQQRLFIDALVNGDLEKITKAAPFCSAPIEGKYPIEYAVLSKNEKAIAFFLERNLSLDPIYTNACTILHLLAETPFTQLFQYAFERLKADVNLPVQEGVLKGWTFAHFAAANNNVSLLKFLKENHANIYLVTKDGFLPFHTSVFFGAKQAAIFLQDENNCVAQVLGDPKAYFYGFFPIHLASCTDNIPLMMKLNSKCCDINQKIEGNLYFLGYTPLHLTAKFKATTSMKILIEMGANVEAITSCGFNCKSLSSIF